MAGRVERGVGRNSGRALSTKPTLFAASRLSADAAEGVDLLGVRSRVDFLSSVLAARHLETPLAIGLFGDWGSGKSFFMRRLQERIRLITERSAQAEEQGKPTLYCSHARQVTFNAWLYADSDIWPSFAAQVFRSVTGAAEDVPPGQIQAGHLSQYQEEVQSLEATRIAAGREEAALDRRLTELDAEIEAKRVEIQTRAGAIGPEAGAAAKLIADLGEISHRLISLVRNWRSIRASDLVMLALPVAVGVTAIFFDWARILAVLAVASGFVALVLSSLRYVERTRALRQEIADLESQKQQLKEERDERARSRAAAERSLGEAVELPLLPQFAEEQAARWLGRQQLGVVTEIRLAFERLSKMIDESRAAGRQTAEAREKDLPIDRVIVYVDDLTAALTTSSSAYSKRSKSYSTCGTSSSLSASTRAGSFARSRSTSRNSSIPRLDPTMTLHGPRRHRTTSRRSSNTRSSSGRLTPLASSA
jgi:hypothetical protein